MTVVSHSGSSSVVWPRLAILTTHPVQYNAPLFRLLAARGRIQPRVFYSWGAEVLQEKYDPGFRQTVSWDIPLLEGYDAVFPENKSRRKGSDHFWGIYNPGIVNDILEFSPDALLVYGWPFYSHIRAMRYFKGRIPVLFRGDSHLLDKKSRIGGLLRRAVLKRVFRHVDTALYAGHSNKEYYLEAGLSENQLRYMPHAVDNDRFSCREARCLRQVRELRDLYGIREGEFVFLFAGKWEKKKDPLLLAESFLRAGFPDSVKLLMVGSGTLAPEIRRRFGNHPSICLGDFLNQSRMPSLYQIADVYVLPSSGPGETWGLSVNEAMANGKAVIVSDKCGCAADLVEGRSTGIVFRSGDGPGLTDALRKMVDDPTALSGMKKNANLLISHFDFASQAKVIEMVLNQSL